MAYYDRLKAKERRVDAQLRAKVLHTEAKALMRAEDYGARDLVPMPWRSVGPKSDVVLGYIEGTRAEDVARYLQLRPIGYAEQPFGTVVYVERPKTKAQERAESRKANAEARIRLRAKVARRAAEGVVRVDGELAKALGLTIRMGEVD